MNLKILCVCTMGLNRSKYLAKYLAEKGYKTRYGGIGPCKFDPEPANPIKKEDLAWADIIIAARKKHKDLLENALGVKSKKIIVLDVSDSRKKAAEYNPSLKELGDREFNEAWTYPKLRKALEKYLPLENYFK